MSRLWYVGGLSNAIVFSIVQITSVFALRDFVSGLSHQDFAETAFVVLAFASTAGLMVNLWLTATRRSYAPAWGLFAFLGAAGAAVVYCLPDRTLKVARGFPVEPMDKS